MRLWDGKRWTLEARPWPTPGAEQASPPALFNWPALVATLALAAGFVASWAGDGLVWFFMFLVMLFGGLGADEKYARRPGRHVALVLAVVGACLVLVLLITGAMSAWEAVWKPA